MVRAFLWMSALAPAFVLPIQAAGKETFKVTAFRKSSSAFYEIVVQGTQKGQPLVCGLKNAVGEIIATDTQLADALATKVLIRYAGSDVVAAVCVPNQ